MNVKLSINIIAKWIYRYRPSLHLIRVDTIQLSNASVYLIRFTTTTTFKVIMLVRGFIQGDEILLSLHNQRQQRKTER